MAVSSSVSIYGQVVQNQVSGTTRELLGIGRQLADELGQQLLAVVFAAEPSAWATEIIELGADHVVVLAGSFLGGYNSDLYLTAMENWCREAKPSILLFGHDHVGRDLAPRLACRLRTGLMPDALELTIDPETRRLVCIRPLYGGNIMSMVTCSSQPELATVRLKSQKPAGREKGRTGAVSVVPAKADSQNVKIRILETVALEESNDLKLEEAEVIVSGGRGMGGAEGFMVVSELARSLDGAVGASRAAVDAGWISSDRQVGLTGKIVSPKLYIAVGISGTIQHMAGCSNAKTIVAINTDPDAPIFKSAHFGVVGDYRSVVPAMVAALRKL